MPSETSANIDDCLVREGRVRERTASLTRRAAASNASPDQLRALAGRIRRETPRAASMLIDLLFEQGPGEAKVVCALLGALPFDPEALARLEIVARRRELSAELRPRMEEALAILSEAAAAEREAVPGPALSGPELWERCAGPNWMSLAPSELGRVWLKRLYPLDPAERQETLESAAAEWDRRAKASRDFPLAPVVEMEARWGGRAMGRWAAEFLGSRRDPASLDALGRLAFHRDAKTRSLAEKALGARPVSGVQLPPPPDRLALCYMSGFGARRGSDPPAAVSGQGNLLISREDKRGLVRQVLMMIDLDERGVVECWGEAGLKPEEFRDFLRECGEAEDADPFRQVPAPLALRVANTAAALSLQGAYALPKEYFFWRDAFAREPYEARQFRVRVESGSPGGDLPGWAAKLVRFDPSKDEPRPW